MRPRLKQARRLKRVVCFVDAAHFVHGTFLGYLWCFTRLLIRRALGPQAVQRLGGDRRGHPRVDDRHQPDTTIDATAICELLRKLSDRYLGSADELGPGQRPLSAVRAGAELLAAELKIELLYLPPYSPNLNLIERLWKFVKKEVLSCRYYGSGQEYLPDIASPMMSIV